MLINMHLSYDRTDGMVLKIGFGLSEKYYMIVVYIGQLYVENKRRNHYYVMILGYTVTKTLEQNKVCPNTLFSFAHLNIGQ